MISTGPPKQQTKELILSGWGDTPHRWLFRDVFCVPKLPGQLSGPQISEIQGFHRFFFRYFWNLLDLNSTFWGVFKMLLTPGLTLPWKVFYGFSLNLKLRKPPKTKPPCLLDPKNSMAAHSKTASNWASFTMSCVPKKNSGWIQTKAVVSMRVRKKSVPQ